MITLVLEKEETFYILPSSEKEDIVRLETMKNVLTLTAPIKPTLDRNMKVKLFHVLLLILFIFLV